MKRQSSRGLSVLLALALLLSTFQGLALAQDGIIHLPIVQGGAGGAPARLAIAAADADKAEGDGGATAFAFTVTRSDNTSGVTSVSYTVSGSGAAPAGGADFAGGALPSSILTFAAGETSKPVTVNVQGDSEVEADEQFAVTLSNPSGSAQIVVAAAIGTIRNDDSGADAIAGAGDMPSADDPEFDKADPEGQSQELPPELYDSGPLVSIKCSTQDWTVADVRDLSDTINLNPNVGVIYPGALVQGAGLEAGQFTPITIPRAGGTIFMSGLKLAPGESYTRTLPVIGAAAVKQATEDILNTEVVSGTTANFSHEEEVTSSYEHLLFELGIDARYQNPAVKASLEGSFSYNSEKSKTFVFMKFVQTYYTVSFEHPAYSTSVFRDGPAFADPEHQIAPGNPPLYVSDVAYGRMVFLVIESDYNAQDVKATLEAAVDGKVAGGKVNSGLTYQQVMAKTKISYHVVGGDAGLALAPLTAATPTEMYNAVKGFLANKDSANFTANSPGAPIAYTLRYLHNRQVARMSYSVNYGKRDCETILAYTNNSSAKRAGMAGGPTGAQFDDHSSINPPEDNKFLKVTSVRIWETTAGDKAIGAVQVLFDGATDGSATGACCPRHGNPVLSGEGSTLRQINLAEDEYIKAIFGTIGPASPPWSDNIVVRSLGIETNKASSDEFGMRNPLLPFRFEAPPGNEIIGFYGRSGDPGLVDAIGVVIRHRYVPTGPDFKVYQLGPASRPMYPTSPTLVNVQDWPAAPSGIVAVQSVTRTGYINESPRSVQMSLADGTQLAYHGCKLGTPWCAPVEAATTHVCQVGGGRHIAAVYGQFGMGIPYHGDFYLESITIALDDGTKCEGPASGWSVDTNYRYEAPPGYQIVGFVGKEDEETNWLDTLGVYLQRTSDE